MVVVSRLCEGRKYRSIVVEYGCDFFGEIVDFEIDALGRKRRVFRAFGVYRDFVVGR